jgi:hypothetical protein
MKNVKITEKDGRIIEVSDLSFDEVRELLRFNGNENGNGHARTTASVAQSSEIKLPSEPKPEYARFRFGLSDHAKRFISILHQNPGGVSADSLAEKLGFKSTNQIGGVTGGGLSKMAKTFNIDLDDIYMKEVTRKDGQRVVIYIAGPEIEKVL